MKTHWGFYLMAFRKPTPVRDIFDELIIECPPNEILERIDLLVDWNRLRDLIAKTYDSSGGGYVGYDPIILLKMLLLSHIYSLSDRRVVTETADRISFRKFTGIALSETIPDDTTLVKFRRRLRDGKIFDKLFIDIHFQLEKRGLRVKSGSIKIVDASVIDSASAPPAKNSEEKARDPEADYTVKRGKPHYGYKLHIARDVGTKLISSFKLTPASVHDSQVFGELLEGNEKMVLADKGYDSEEIRKTTAARGIDPLILFRKRRGRKLHLLIKDFNRDISKLRAPVENSFANLKRWRRCGRAIYLGMERVKDQMIMGIMAHNLMGATKLLENCVQIGK